MATNFRRDKQKGLTVNTVNLMIKLSRVRIAHHNHARVETR